MDKSDSRRKTDAAAPHIPEVLRRAAEAAFAKKAENVVVLDLHSSAAFTDYFLLCSGQSTRQVKAIVDAIEASLTRLHVRPAHVEGYDRAEWVLLDCFDFVVHVFTRETRAFYSLERLWGNAERIEVPDEFRTDSDNGLHQ